MIGKRFGRLLVVKEMEPILRKNNRKRRIYECLCDCGNLTNVTKDNLNSGNTKSCGCFEIENRIYHGLSSSPEYKIYYSMLQRCYSNKCDHYYLYGARGIVVCDRWKSSFINFYEDMGPRPNREYTLERIDNNGNYCPENCKWLIWYEQYQNTRMSLWNHR